METNDSDASASAAQLLHRQDEIRSRVQDVGPSRGYSWLVLSSGLLLGVYVGIYLFVSSSSADAAAASGGYTGLMLLPVLLFSALVSGARDRFRIRTKPSIGRSTLLLLSIVAFVTLGTLTLGGVVYPWWLNVLIPVVLFSAMAASPIRQLSTGSSAGNRERWLNLPMSASARWSTGVIGVVLGLLAAFSMSPWFPLVSSATLMMTLLAALVGWRAPWGLPRTGYQWGPIHWLAFATSITAIFLLVVLLATSAVVAAPIPLLVGGLVGAAMVSGALFPLRTHRQ